MTDGRAAALVKSRGPTHGGETPAMTKEAIP
nr:MAG TPA: hypothetical protein [Caudoviricetes sp.]